MALSKSKRQLRSILDGNKGNCYKKNLNINSNNKKVHYESTNTRKPFGPVENIMHDISYKNLNKDLVSFSEELVSNSPCFSLDFDIDISFDIFEYDEYVTSVFEYLRNIEIKYLTNPKSYRDQPFITEDMRSILIDWLIQIHDHFNLKFEAMFLCVHMLDRFIDIRRIPRESFQLVGCACLFTAGKYFDQLVPEAKEFQRLTNGAFRCHELSSMEFTILNTLKFDLSPPISLQFFRRYCKLLKCSDRIKLLGEYILLIYLFDPRISSILPSVIATASIYLSILSANESKWDDQLCIHYTGYSSLDFGPILKRFACISSKLEQDGIKYVYSKYIKKSNDFMKISEFVNSSKFVPFCSD